MELNHQLTAQLKHLRLSGILASLADRQQQAVAGKWSYSDFLERLLQDEVERRAQKQLHLRLRRATLDPAKTLETFDFQFNPTINRQQFLALAAGDFIRRKRNVLLCGPTGVGKSHLAQALGQEACRRGFEVLLVNAYQLLQQLHAGRADDSYQRRLKTCLRPDLLILDDFGLKPLQPPAPSDLYDLINERYQKGSILLTSNRPPAEWLALFGDPLLGAAGIDRLCHQAEIIIIQGDSFRAQARHQTPPEVTMN